MASDRQGRVRGRGLQVETLEGRALLSGAAVAHRVAEAATSSVVTIGGTVSGTASPYSNAKTPVDNTLISARGTMAGLPGNVLLGGFQTSTLKGLTATISNGKASFAFTVAAKPNTAITVNYSGGGHYLAGTQAQTLTLTGTISGGTGVFAGAQGTFAATVKINDLTGAFTMTDTFRITKF